MLQQGWARCLEETKGRGIIAPEEKIVDEVQNQQDEELAAINARFTVNR